MSLKNRFLDLPSGIQLHLRQHTGSGPHVLAVHGFLDTGRSFDSVAEALGGQCAFSALDWRGHGGSSGCGPGGSYHQLDHLKDLIHTLRLLEEEGQAPEIIVAHSMGAAIALLAAGLQPELFPKYFLVLDNLGGFAAKDDASMWDRWAGLLDSIQTPKRSFRDAHSRRAAEERVQKNNPELPPEIVTTLVRSIAEPKDEQDSDGPQRFRFVADLRGPNPVFFSQSAWLELCTRVEATTHVLAPEGGYFAKRGFMQDRVHALKDGRVTNVPSCGHHIHLQCPNKVAESILEFIPPRGTPPQ